MYILTQCISPTSLVPVTEASIVIAISSPHRREALEAVQFAIDTLKATVPIWKKVRFCLSNICFMFVTTIHMLKLTFIIIICVNIYVYFRNVSVMSDATGTVLVTTLLLLTTPIFNMFGIL
jgi:hypothetical protein